MSRLGALLLWLIVCGGLLLHMVPSLVTGEPFSTDVWPLIRASEKIVSSPDVRIWDDAAFDGYNNRWPGVILSSSIFSLATGFSPRLTYSFFLLSASLLASSLILYVFAKRVAGEGALALPLVWLFYPSLAVFSSSLLKEVYAYPFLFTLLLLATGGLRRDALIASVATGALVLSHHLASVMASSMLLSLAVVCYALKAVGYYRGLCPVRLGRCTALGFFTGGVFLAYYLAYGGEAMRLRMSFSDAALLAVYACYLVFGVVVYLKFSRVGYVEGLVGVAVPLLLLLSSRTPAVPGLGVDYRGLLPYVVPALAPYLLLSSRMLPSRERLALVYALAIPPSVFSLYVLLARPELASIMHRLMNYYFLPAGILLAVLSSAKRRALKIGVVAVLLSLVLSASSFVVLSARGEGPAFYWRYGGAEVESLVEVSRLLAGGVVGGDDKVYYFYTGVVNVDKGSVLAYSYAGRTLPPGLPVVVLKEYSSRGYVSGLSVYRVEFFLASLGGFDRLFDSGEVVVAARG